MLSGRHEPVRGGSRILGDRMAPRPLSSSASIAPVGLEVEGDPNESSLEPPKEEAQQTGPFRIPMQRRRLGGVVAGTVAGCALILVAAVIARGSQANRGPATAANAMKSSPATAVVPETSWEQPRQGTGPAATLAALSQTVGDTIISDAALTGTVRLHRPGAAGHVWIDGKKLTSTSALVGCGVHQIKVGARAKPRSVDVPCGGEIVISK
jgi:hypothetical protein